MDQFYKFLENILENIIYLIREWNWSSWNWWPSWQAEIKIYSRYVNKIWIDFTGFLKILPYLKKRYIKYEFDLTSFFRKYYLPDLSKNGVDPLEVFEDVEEVATSKSGSSFMIAIYCWFYLKWGKKIRFFSFHFLKTLYYFEIDAFNFQVN